MKSHFEKNQELPTEESTFLISSRQVVAHGRSKAKENSKLLALKVVAVSYARWSPTGGSEYNDLTGKLLRN